MDCDSAVADLKRRRDQAHQSLQDLDVGLALAIEHAAAEHTRKTEGNRLKMEIIETITSELSCTGDADIIASYLMQEEFHSWDLIRTLDAVTMRTVLEQCFCGKGRPEWSPVRLGQAVKLLNALKGTRGTSNQIILE